MTTTTTHSNGRTKAHETLTAAEVVALRAAADAAGGWRALARAWPEVSAATLARLADGRMATPIVLFVARVRLAQHSAPGRTQPPRLAGVRGSRR